MIENAKAQDDIEGAVPSGIELAYVLDPDLEPCRAEALGGVAHLRRVLLAAFDREHLRAVHGELQAIQTFQAGEV